MSGEDAKDTLGAATLKSVNDAPATGHDSTSLDALDVSELGAAYEATFKALAVQVGIALRARTRLHSVLASLRSRQQSAHASSTSCIVGDEEVVLLQQFGIPVERSGPPDLVARLDALDVSRAIVNLTQIKQLSAQYNALGKVLARIVHDARQRLESELPALAKEEADRVAQQETTNSSDARQTLDAGQTDLVQQATDDVEAKAEKDNNKFGDAIVLDDDDDDDDVPLAGSNSTTSQAQPSTIDLTSPSLKPASSNATSQKSSDAVDTNNLPNNPAALLASLGVSGGALSQALAAVGQSSSNDVANVSTASSAASAAATVNEPMNLNSFDFNSFGLTGLPNAGDGQPSGNLNFDGINVGGDADMFGDSLLNFNNDQADGVDLSFLSKLDGGSGSDSNNLLGNIDFSALLGNNG